MTISATVNHSTANLAQSGLVSPSTTAGQIDPFFNHSNSFSPAADRLDRGPLADRFRGADTFSEKLTDQRNRKTSQRGSNHHEVRGGVGDSQTRRTDRRVSPFRDQDGRVAASQPHQTDPARTEEETGKPQASAEGRAIQASDGSHRGMKIPPLQISQPVRNWSPRRLLTRTIRSRLHT